MSTSSTAHLPTASYRPSHDGRATVTVLRATLDELADRGYASASLRTIAARADVPLETVFTRWRSKQQLVAEAIGHLARRSPTPETGDVRTDLRQVVEALVELLTHPGAASVLRSSLAPAVGDDVRVDLLGERRAAIRRILERGQRRQQLPDAVHPGVAADAVVGALVYRLLLSGDVIDRHTARHLVDAVVAGAGADVA